MRTTRSGSSKISGLRSGKSKPNARSAATNGKSTNEKKLNAVVGQ